VALIEALRTRGNLAEALQVYDEVRRLLQDELGATPGRELVALHGRLLVESDELSRPSPPASDRSRTLASRDLVEREHELHAIANALEQILAGRGAAVLLEGPAGIGKTRLLGELQTAARERKALVLTARGGVLEREFPFGVVRQLFAPVAEELVENGTPAVRAVLGDTANSEGTFPILDGLFRATERLAASRPVVLCIDDLQWSDPASMRFVAYLARRIASISAMVAVTVRTGEPEADEALLAELAQEPVALVLDPRPLSPDASAQLVRRRFGGDAAQDFTGACHEVTAGNPLLLEQLLSSLHAEGVTPDAEHVPAVREIGPRAVARTVRLRLARLSPPAGAVARAVAVLGAQPGLRAIAALADTDEPAAAEALQALIRAEILRNHEPLGFVHPLIREAIYGELPSPARALEHERAGRILAEQGASAERVAAQLLLTPPRGDAWVVGRLRRAADDALRRGAPDAAMRLLERAQAEPPPPDQMAALALELGGSAAYLRGPAGVEPLRKAYAELTDPAERGRAAIALSHLLLFVRSPQEGVELAHQASEELPEEMNDLRDGLRAVRLVGAAFGAVDPAEFRSLDDVRRGPRGTGPGARALTAMTALALALTCKPASEASALAREAFSAGLDAIELTAPIALGTAALALGDPAEGLVAIQRYADFARRRGEILSTIGADLWGGITHLWAGDLPAAMAALERAHEGERLWGTKLDAVMAYSAAFTALVRLERGDPTDAVSASLHTVQADDPRPDGARFWLASLAELALAEGRPLDAVAITKRLEPTRPPDTHPVWAPWRGLRARALAELGEYAEARRLLSEELDLARRVGTPWVIGREQRMLSELGGPDQLENARQAVTQLAGSSARLELAKARFALAQALLAADEITGAREELTQAAALAEDCGAVILAERAAKAAAGSATATRA
jgi:tetratricopeptide (TPR) repeat protein